MSNSGYFIDSIGRQDWFRCLRCQYDSFSRESVQVHVKTSCLPKGLPEEDLTTDEWLRFIEPNLINLRRRKVGISLLTWNTAQASKYAAMTIVQEAQLLSNLGIESAIFWADNGSTDETVPLLTAIFGDNLAAKSLFSSNLGQSKARNDLRASVLAADCDYWLMVDGDIEIIPYSAFALMRFMEEKWSDAGCIGMYCRNCTHKRDPEVAQFCRKIEPWMASVDTEIAWTNYGMFRRAVFEQVAFDEEGPFAGPGWGFEDDDYYLQMQELGFFSVNTKYFRHMHRRRHSSLKLMNPADSLVNYKARQKYMIEKWHGTKRATVLANQTMPILEY